MDRQRILEKVDALSNCGVLVLDADNNIVHASGAASTKLLGRRNVMNAPSLVDLDLPNELLAQLNYNVKTSFSLGVNRSITTVVPISGQARLWSFTFAPSYDDLGRPEAMVVSLHDIGGAPLEKTDSGCASLFSDAQKVPFLPGSLISIVQDDLTVAFMNTTALASLGTEKDDVVGKTIRDVLPSASSELLNDIYKVAASRDVIIRTESACIQGTGVRYLRWIITPSNIMGERRLSLAFSDVTDLISSQFKNMSAVLFQEREILRTIIDTIPIGLLIADNNGNIWLSNSRADRLFTSGNRPLSDIQNLEGFDEEGHKMDWCDWPICKAIRDRETITGQIVIVRPSAEETRTTMVSAAPLQSNDGSFLGGISVFNDITDQKKIEEKMMKQSEALRRSNEELQQFAYAASHDLKEPLRMVNNYLMLLKKHLGGDLDDRSQSFMSYAIEGATRMRKMVDQLLEYSRVEKGDEMCSQVDMGEVTDRVINDLQMAVFESHALIDHGRMPVVPAIEAQMIQLMENLVSNAIKFQGDEAPRVEISAMLNDDEWVFSVKDNGIGIDPKYADRIFTMFQRLHTREEYPGTGMGLALARRIVEHHGGRIWFESEPGKGSTFFFTVPATRRPEC